jgi:hypothetical protein
MKIRMGFVSNSSSSSFVCWGVSKDNIPLTDESRMNAWKDELDDLKNDIDSENFSSWRPKEKVEAKYAKLLAMNDEEKIEYGEEIIENDSESFYGKDCISIGGQENDEVGIEVSTMEKNFKDVKFSNVRNFVAKKLNEIFGTNFTDKDISYFESGWYDG